MQPWRLLHQRSVTMAGDNRTVASALQNNP
ncbi:hypothetical protein AAY23_10021, partial [Frankia casuarinae]